MTKKKQSETSLDFTKPEIGIRKLADNINNFNPPSFKIVDSPCVSDIFCEIKLQIEQLKEGKRLEISNTNTGLNMYDLKTKIRNIVFAHQRKYVEKKFTTQQINRTTLAIDRQTNIKQ